MSHTIIQLRNSVSVVLLVLISTALIAQKNTNQNMFRQLGTELPTPNVYRTASGAPGHQYWQQKADYEIEVRLDDSEQRIDGEETITYHNNSPDDLSYLWVQLDQNMRAKDSDTYKVRSREMPDKISASRLNRMQNEFDGGFKIQSVTDDNGDDMSYTINKTMMRINLEEPLESGDKIEFDIKWWYNINDRMKIGGRSGYEYFPEDDNYLYTIAQFYPRMAVYIDNEGWQNKQFLGRGEFALTFGDYDVKITVPDDHMVSSTGVLQNPDEVLTDPQQERLEKARNSYDDPVIIVTEEEAIDNEKDKSSDYQTWHFEAENVRDFAFANSRKFIWDAMAVKMDNGEKVMAMSMYPKEGNPLWEQYSTKAVAHTLRWYSHYTFSYPYPVAWSIHAKSIGMEYPMICFNFGRPDEDGTYSSRTKYGMISVIIHEVGHNYFPMIVNSDERQWTWMDEGLNTFVQYLTEQHWERNYPSRRGPAYKITDYMGGDKSNITPIMTNSESIFQFGNNAYGKPATALNILRETIMGRELFDYAFKTYAQRWKFKHPTPADFFRTMEDASAVDLDWFWRGWFYTTNHVDLSIKDVEHYKLNSKDPKVAKAKKEANNPADRYIGNKRNEESIDQTYVEKDSSLVDFYTKYDPYEVNVIDEQEYNRFRNSLSEEEKETLKRDQHFYEVTIANKGGLVMPIILQFTYADGTKEVHRIPAEIWRFDQENVSKVFVKDKKVTSVELDPFLETADVNTSNNVFPHERETSRFDLYQRKQRNDKPNMMQKMKKAKKSKMDSSGTN